MNKMKPSKLRMLRISLVAILIICSQGFFRCGGDKPTAPKKEPLPQIIQDPTVSNIQASSATISWVTDIEATSTIRYGLVSGQLIFRDSSATRVTTHTRTLQGLRSNTNYFFRVSSSSPGGYVESAEYSFRTGLGVNDLGPAAWSKYEAGLYWEAIVLFKQLLQMVPTSFEACNGLGWCYAVPSIDSLQTSLEYFRMAINLKANFPDAYAGRGFVQLALKSYAFAIDDFHTVLTANPNYVFSHNRQIDYRDIRLGLAEAYYYIQNFSAAQAQVDVLAPNNGLQMHDPTTWIVDGKNYTTYAEALLAWLEKLMRMI